MKPVLVLLVSVWALDVFCANIPEPCPYSEYQDWYKLGSLCVKYYSTPLKFTDAEIFCRRVVPGGHLVSVHTKDSNSNILEILQKSNKSSISRIWLGAYKLLKESSRFVWTDESPWNYANWDTNEPNNQGNNEDCVEMNWTKSEKWNDLPCTENKTFICAFDITFCE